MDAPTENKTSEYIGTEIPTSRGSRLASIAGLAFGIAGSVASGYAAQLTRGNTPELKDVLLTQKNAQRVANKLKSLRGAALKLGQLISLDSGEFLPQELSLVLNSLRDNVNPMPFSKLTQVLNNEWGEHWHESFSQFSFTPIASASIGQVHSAHDLNNQRLAVKIQYPGVSESIDSDVDNVGTILKYSGLFPDIEKIKHLLNETKQQLHYETDYLKEAQWINKYYKELQHESNFIVPEVNRKLTKKNILCMSFHEGENIDKFTHLDQEEKNNIITALINLTFKEIFEFGHVQTDPNFANYLYQEKDKKIVLLDFGATRELSEEITDGYKMLLKAAINSDKAAIDKAISKIGFFQENITSTQRESVVTLFDMACEPFRHRGEFDFGSTHLAREVSIAAKQLSFKNNYWHTPPATALFLHRKFAGLYFIASKLNAKINLQHLIIPYIENTKTHQTSHLDN